MFSGAVQLLLKFGPDIAKLGYDYLNPKIGMLPRVRADAVAGLNSLHPTVSTPWTPECLFLFFAAFVTTGSNTPEEWMRPKPEIVALLTRGVDDARQKSEVEAKLTVAMNEVPEMIRLAPSLSSKKFTPTPQAAELEPSLSTRALVVIALRLIGGFLVPGGVSLVNLATSVVGSIRDEKLNLAIVRYSTELEPGWPFDYRM